MIKRNSFLMILIMSIYPLIGQNMTEFRAFFQEAKFDYLHVYSEWNNNNSEYPKASIFPFKGKKIDAKHYPLFSSIIKTAENSLYATTPDFYAAIYRFFISARMEIFIIRGHEESMREQPIYYVIFDRIQNKFTKAIEISNFFGYESSFGNQESWLVDLNEDGVLDILTRSWTETTQALPNDEVKITETDTLRAFFWKENQLLTKDVSHLVFLKSKFELHNVPSLEYQEQQKLTLALTGKPYESKRQEYFLVIGENRNLKEAVARKEEFGGYLSPKNYVYLGDKHIEIYFYNGYYFTVIRDFANQQEAEIALIEAKEKIHQQVYLQAESKWCSQRMELNCVEGRACFYQCKQ